MPQFLLELFSEEIPARMQKRAAEDLKKLLMDALSKAGFLPSGIETFSAPRRLTAVVEGLPERTADVKEERKGPKVGAPEQALAGFLRAAGLNDISQARIEPDAKKGDYYVADLVKAGQATPDAIAAIIPDIIRNFPWPKSMRWGEGTLRWVRPLHRIVAVFDGEIVPFEVDDIVSGNVTEGHRFHGTGTFSVRDYDDYEAKLTAAHVVLDRDERKQRIAADARTLCQARNLELVEDEGLLEEVCGLVDEPHVIMGDMDPAFLDLPPEVIRLTLRVNQKYFVVRDPATGKLAPHFIVVSNVAATDGGKLIVQGNARVLAARLNDARYFWDLDRKTALEDRVAKLDTLVFHEKLGSVGDKVRRMGTIVAPIAQALGLPARIDYIPADGDSYQNPTIELADLAVEFCKADLTTEMVGEFPELQGIMGRYYAQNKNQAQPVCDAIRDHYKPIGPSDSVPTYTVAIIVALADKIDSLVGFFSIGEKPTGSGDPFALRRAALGVLRIIIENKLKSFDLFEVLDKLWPGKDEFDHYYYYKKLSDVDRAMKNREVNEGEPIIYEHREVLQQHGELFEVIDHTICLPELKTFFQDRLKVELLRYGYSAEHIEIYVNGWLGQKLGYAREVLDCLQASLTPPVHASLTAVARRTWNILEKARSTLTPSELDTWITNQDWGDDAVGADAEFLQARLELRKRTKDAIDFQALLDEVNLRLRKDGMQTGSESTFVDLFASAEWRSMTTAESELGAIYQNLQQKITDATEGDNFEVALKSIIQFEQPLARYFEDVFVEEPGKRMDRLAHLAKVYKLISMVGDFR
jgi:glycyl-tRNA synthetase beta chain